MAQISYDVDATTVILGGRVLSDFIAGTTVQITFPNPDTSRFNGSGGSVSVAKRTDAKVSELEFHILRGSADDVWLSTLQGSGEVNLLNASVSTLYKLDGKAKTETFTFTGGSITDQPQFTFANTDHNAEMTYKLQFRDFNRSI
ncbi:hypothetical protein [Arsenophonus nasoniae]|uniref:Uncharacterized protein n=1 Tax=Arsenophonus nasoniae TaxID=638 RepID=A0AA95KF52_9GAMM|nr:hypothetical protein [Arsenophonus nasoniae]WGM03530.1 hypothetical protein QE210_19160 [Arsenophonus nasoniae]WGM03818.1 hypothetical protein QE210_20245 [Arsenophonus nasoniae]